MNTAPSRHFERSEKSRLLGRKYAEFIPPKAGLDFSATPRNDNLVTKLIKQINDIFIQIILVVFYMFGIGLGALLHAVFIKKRQTRTYWQDVKNEKVDLSSPY